MFEQMKQVLECRVTSGQALSRTERDLFRYSCMNLILQKRNECRNLAFLHAKPMSVEPMIPYEVLSQYQRKVDDDLKQKLSEMLNVITPSLLILQDTETNVLLLTLNADLQRYMCEIVIEEDVFVHHYREARESYMVAVRRARTLSPMHPIRLTAFLQTSVFFAQIMNYKELAIIVSVFAIRAISVEPRNNTVLPFGFTHGDRRAKILVFKIIFNILSWFVATEGRIA